MSDANTPAGEGGRGPLNGLAVAVIGIYFAPDTTGIAPYTTELCNFLAEAGMRVDAVVGVPHYPRWRANGSHSLSLLSQETRGRVQIHRVRHLVPRRHDVVGRALYEATFGILAMFASRKLRPDLVIAVTPNISAVPAASKLARRRGVPLVVIVQDLVGLAVAQSGIDGGKRLSSAVARMETRWISQAERVAIITPAFGPHLQASGVDPDRLVHLPNYSHIEASKQSAVTARRQLGWPLDRPLVVHTGNMGYKQDLGNIIEVARLLVGRSDAMFVLMGDGNTRPALEKQAAGVDNLRLVAPVDGRVYPSVLAAADILLVNERPSVLDMSMPSKLTSYMRAGRAIVAAVHTDGATATEVRRSGAGIVVPPGDPAALASAIQQMLGSPTELAALGAAAESYAESHLSRAAARERSINLVASVLSQAVRGSTN